jgi:hypothetical protein
VWGSRFSLLLALWSGTGCYSREIPVHPFRIEALDGTGAPIATALAEPTLVTAMGIARRVSGTVLRVETQNPQLGTIQISFDNSMAPAIQFPDLEGQAVEVQLNIHPDIRGPAGPLTVLAFRVSAGGQIRFLMGEDPLATAKAPVLLVPLGAMDETEALQIPYFEVVADGVAFEPSRCGDAYYDRLMVRGASRTAVLEHGERATFAAGEPAGLPSWTVFHVSSWHRPGYTGSGAERPPRGCSADAVSWTQIAAWR